MDFYEDNHVISSPQKIMVVALRNGEKPPFADSVKDAPEIKSKEFRIDIEGISNRTYPLPINAGNYFYVKGGNGKVSRGG